MMEIKNFREAAKEIITAIKNKKKIILYGDADLDGVASVVILKESIRNLGGEVVAVYFPDRESEGYGITKTGLNYLQKFSPALLIALDLGIGNFEEVEIAQDLGFEVIIIDHHQTLGRLPKGAIIIDPKQKGDSYPFKSLATVGITFKFSQALLQKKLTEKLRESFLELVALATISDLMPRSEENELFIEEGLESLKSTWRPGLQAFFSVNSLWNCSSQEVARKIISSLNAAEKKGHLNEAYLLLTEKDEKEAKSQAEILLEKSHQRQMRIKEITIELDAIVSKKDGEEIIFEGNEKWPLTLLGPVASRICQKYQKATFLFREDKEESQGAVRVPSGLDSVKMMGKCAKLLETYGGHPQASGFRVKNKNLEKFKICLNDNL
jgi:single-stranded-DNA-specific exonuclease